MPTPSELWEQVKARVDYAEFFAAELGADNPLLGTGAERRAHCPFPGHADHTPSFGANMETGRWLCRTASCGKHGDAIALYMALHGVTFAEAAQSLAARYNVPQTANTAPHDPAALARRNDAALDSYTAPAPERTIDPGVIEGAHARLMQQPELLRYLTEQRGLTLDTIEQYKLGRDGQRYTIPIPNAAGDYVNVRRYLPNADAGDKMKSYREGYGKARLWPLEAFHTPGRIILCAGEWDCLVARQHGFNAITHTGGEGTWKDEWTPLFAGRDVVICYDSDDAGRAGARMVARALHGVAASVRVCALYSDRDDGSDVSDYFVRDGGTAEQFTALLDAAPEYVPEANPFAGYAYLGGDVGNGLVFVREFVSKVRYDGVRWLWFDNMRWVPDEIGFTYELAKQVALRLTEMADAEGIDEAQQKRLRSEAQRLRTHAGITRMLEAAKSDPLIRVSPDRFDCDPWLVNFKNGTLDLRTEELRPHDPADLITNLVDVEYDRNATCPRFRAFIRQMFRHDEFLQRWFGYLLTGLATEQKMLFLWGQGANGKTTLLNLMRLLFGTYATTISGELLTAKPASGPQPEVVRLRSRRVGIISEMPEFQALNMARVKGWTGGDIVVARGHYQNPEEFPMQARLNVASNHRPAIHDPSDGAWRRILLLPCTVQIAAADQDAQLEAKLREERSGILTWAVQGCMMWQRDGLPVPAEMLAATATYRAESDTLGQFFTDRCDLGSDYRTPAADLYTAYKAWADGRGGHAMTATTFGRQLSDRGIGTRRSNGIVRIGLRLKDAPAPEYLQPSRWTPDADAGGPEW